MHKRSETDSLRSGRARVAFVLPSFAGGGAQRVLLNIIGGLDRSFFAPLLVVFEKSGPWISLVPDDLPVVCLNRPRLRAALPVLLQTLRAERPDVIVSTMAYMNLGMLLMRPFLTGRPRLFLREANTVQHHASSAWGKFFYRLGYRLLYRGADRLLCPAQFIADELVSRHGVDRARVAVFPNPIDEKAVRLSASSPRRHPGSGQRFVAVGRLTRQKGYDRLLRDFAALPGDAHLTIFGEGELRDALVRQADQLGLTERVMFAGFDAEATSWVAGADALLLPSRWEGMPNAALEALACGTPVIASPEAGGIAEVASIVSSGMVTLAASGPAFVAAMRSVEIRVETTLRPSSLPEVYRLDHVATAFAALVAA